MMLNRIFAQVPLDYSNIPKVDATNSNLFATALTIFFGILGAVSLLMITLAGLRYVTSRGEPQTVAQAKNTILYAVVGLVVSFSAIAIVTFVAKGVSN